MTDSTPRFAVVILIAATAVLLGQPAFAATFYAPPINAQPGGNANVCVWMSGGNDQVAGLQMDISWDAKCMVPASGGSRPKCRSNPDTGKTVQSATRGATTLRAIMISFSDVDPIPDGELFCCEFRVVDQPAGNACSLAVSNVIASTPTGQKTDARFDRGRGAAVNVGRAPAPVAGVAPKEADARADSNGGDSNTGGDDVPADSGGNVAEPQQDPGAGSGTGGGGRAAAEPGSGGSGTNAGGGATGGAAPLGVAPAMDAVDRAADDSVDAVADAAGETGDALREAGKVLREAVERGRLAAEDAVDEGIEALSGDEEPTATPDADAKSSPKSTPAPATTPTPAATAAAATTAAPTATARPATPTAAPATATPEASSGFLGGCTLIVD